MRKRISQRDIARILNVNVSTVSRALRGLPGVSPELRKQVLELAEDKDYRPNPFAISLRYGSTRTIGVVVPDITFLHYASIVKWIEAEARENGYMCILTDSGDNYSNEVKCVERLISMHVEGIVMCLSQETTEFKHLQMLKKSHIPVVLFDRVADIYCSTVSFNDVEAARQATLYLIDSGAKRVAYLGGPNRIRQTVQRKHGYLEALRERCIAIKRELVKCGHACFNSGLAKTMELLSMPEPPDAILADYGRLAISAFHAVISMGLRIPQDVSIIGFMSDDVSGILSPPMTFVKQNHREMGQKTVNVLIEHIKGDTKVRHVVVKTSLCIRNSTLPCF